MCLSEEDATVRSQLAATAGRFPGLESLQLISHLSKRDADAADPMIPLQLWWSLQPEVDFLPEEVVREALVSKWPANAAAREHLLPKTVRALAESGKALPLSLCAKLLDAARSHEDRELLLTALDRGLEGAPVAEGPPELIESLARIGRGGSGSLSWLRASVRLGSESAYAEALSRLADPKRSAEGLGLIELVGAVPRSSGRAALVKRLDGKIDDATVLAVLAALGHYPDEDVATSLVGHYAAWNPSARSRAIDVLASRKPWAVKLVAAIGPKGVPPGDLKAPQAQRIVDFGDAALTARLEAAWGKLPGRNSAARARRIAEVRGVLPEGDKGVAARGAVVFKNNCMACHRLFGEGERIGPELTGAQRGDLDFLLSSLVDPSAVVRKEYAGQTFALKDGRVLTGMVVEEDGRTLTLFDAQKQKTTIAKSEIEERKAAEASIMPEGLLDTLTEEQVRDLFRYLQGTGR